MRTTSDGIRLAPSNLITFTPVDVSKDDCLWNLHQCSTLTLTLVLTVGHNARSSTIYLQKFQHNASIHVDLIVEEARSMLQFDLWLPATHELLRTRLREFPPNTALFLELAYRAPSSLSLSLYGQLVEQTRASIGYHAVSSLAPSSFQFGRYNPELVAAHVHIQSIGWSYERSICKRPVSLERERNTKGSI